MPTNPKHPSNDPKPEAVVFDLDGLLIDTEWAFAEAASRLLKRRGLELEPAFFATMMGTPARDALPRFRLRYQITDSLEALAAEYRADFTALFPDESPRLMPGAADLIARLERADVPKAIATSSSRQYVDAVFGPHGLIDRFAFVLTCDDVTHGKPHPEVYASHLDGCDCRRRTWSYWRIASTACAPRRRRGAGASLSRMRTNVAKICTSPI